MKDKFPKDGFVTVIPKSSVVQASAPTLAESMVKTWGEVVNKTVAAIMLGISRRQVIRLAQSGALKTAADGRILVREAAEWIEKGSPVPEKPKPRIHFVK